MIYDCAGAFGAGFPNHKSYLINHKSSWKTLLNFVLLRGSAIMGATVSRQVA